MKYLIVVAFFFFVPVHSETLVDTILTQYGYPAFKQAEIIRFTFTAKVAGLGPKHTWIWKPKSDSVTLVEDGFSYSRKKMEDKEKAVDKKFINDQYWLVFPFHLGMDKDSRIEIDSGLTVSPKNHEKLRRVTVTYLQGNGYSPGDRYELFVQPDGLIKEWTYHKSGGKFGVSWTWENNVRFKDVLFSQVHQGIPTIQFSEIVVE